MASAKTEARIAAGLCTYCGKREHAPDKKLCQCCLDERAKYKERVGKDKMAWYNSRKAKGLCTACGRVPSAEGKLRCDDCLTKAKKYPAQRKAAGICTQCGKAPRAEGRARCVACLEIGRQQTKRYFAEHPDYDKQRTSEIKREVFEHYGGCRCALCGHDNLEVLTIDHINGGGNQHRKQIGGGGAMFYRHLRKEGYPEGYRVLCMNCQFLALRDVQAAQRRASLARRRVEYGISEAQ